MKNKLAKEGIILLKNATGQNGHAQLRSIQTTSGIPFPDVEAINCVAALECIVSPSTSH
ncbi:hypothetical protein [Limnovirga soli]|uniref:hypothetical protein n=1 Tax=Limnovirga soli TaxID=2656915 RepID=UPI001490F1EC|nr:hypothetical protein [Limnovirga soli]